MARQNQRAEALKELQLLTNIGPKTAEALYFIGIKSPAQLKKSNPEKLYEKMRKKHGGKLDRCVLYVLRGAILNKPWPKCTDKTK